MDTRLKSLVIFLLFSAAAPTGAVEDAPVSVRPAKFDFTENETIEITVTNISADPAYLIPAFSSYPYDYFYPPDNYLERFDGEYWRPMHLIRDNTYYDKRLLFVELAAGGEKTLTCAIADFAGAAENPGGEYRAVVNVIAGAGSPITSWKDFKIYGSGRQVTAKSFKFNVTVSDGDDGE